MKTFIISLVIIITLGSCEKDFISAAQDPVDARENLYGKKFAVRSMIIRLNLNKESVITIDFINNVLVIGSDTNQSVIMFTATYSGTNITLDFVSNPNMSGVYKVLHTEMNQGIQELILQDSNNNNEFILIQ